MFNTISADLLVAADLPSGSQSSFLPPIEMGHPDFPFAIIALVVPALSAEELPPLAFISYELEHSRDGQSWEPYGNEIKRQVGNADGEAKSGYSLFIYAGMRRFIRIKATASHQHVSTDGKVFFIDLAAWKVQVEALREKQRVSSLSELETRHLAFLESKGL